MFFFCCRLNFRARLPRVKSKQQQMALTVFLHLKQSDDRGMIEPPHDFDFSADFFQILLIEIRLVHNFDGHTRFREPVHAETHNGKIALPERIHNFFKKNLVNFGRSRNTSS